MITIVNYGLGNLGSIRNMLHKLGEESIITSDREEIAKAKKIILPGVGAFDTGMQQLEDLALVEILHQKALVEHIPVLGICLGIQLMTKRSDEGLKQGLGWFDAETVAFDFKNHADKYTIPNMGWNELILNRPSRLFEETTDEQRFYFVHSYYIKPNNEEDVIASAHYGFDYCVALAKNNLLGVQFHPEKSHKYGMRLLENFINRY